MFVASPASAGEPPEQAPVVQAAKGELRLDVVERIEGMRITCGSEVIDKWDEPFPVPMGKYWVEATAPGHERFKQMIVIDEPGMVVAVKIMPLAEEGSDATHGPGYENAPSSLQFVLGSVVAGVGLLGVGFGLGLGIVAKNKRDEAAQFCPIDGACLQQGVELIDDAQGVGNISTGLTIVGAALLVGGIVMWATAPSSSEDEPAADSEPEVGEPEVGEPEVGARLRSWFGPNEGGVAVVGWF